jgi:hypothetical protein
VDRDERISGEARAMAAGVIARGGQAPSPARIAELADLALSEERDAMTPAEIRELAARALSQAQQISWLMNRLADLLAASPEAPGG